MRRSAWVTFAVGSILVGCATPSAYTERKFLEGTLDPSVKAQEIFDALKRNDTVKKEVELASGKKNTVSDGVEIEIAPFTRPLVVARAREKFEEQAFKEKWSESKKEAAIQEYITMFEPSSGKQCFDVAIKLDYGAAIDGFVPPELDLKLWYGKLSQNGVAKDFQLQTNPACLVTTTTEARTYGISKFRSYRCFSNTCVKTKLDLTQPFKVEFDIRYRKDLQPLVLEWKGVKD